MSAAVAQNGWERRPLTYRITIGEPLLDLKAYEAFDGYAALRKTLKEMQPADVTAVVKELGVPGCC